MIDTSGFYKKDGTDLQYGPHFVDSPSYVLRREEREQHDYPVDGWYWFGSELDARNFFNLPLEEG